MFPKTSRSFINPSLNAADNNNADTVFEFTPRSEEPIGVVPGSTYDSTKVTSEFKNNRSPLRKKGRGKIFNFFGRVNSFTSSGDSSQTQITAKSNISNILNNDDSYMIGGTHDSNNMVTTSDHSSNNSRDQFSGNDTYGGVNITNNLNILDESTVASSQFSQGDFSDRFATFNNISNKEGSFIMHNEDSNFSVEPFYPLNNNSNNNNHHSGPMKPKNSSLLTKVSNSSSVIETEKQIDIIPPLKNIFLPKAKIFTEKHFEINEGYKYKRPAKLWVSAFKDRPREIVEFEEVKLIGEGTFSSVSCVRNRLDGSLYALKRLKERILSESQRILLLRECNALSVVSGCINIIQYYSCWIYDDHLYIQTEVCHLGSLENIITNETFIMDIMLRSDKRSYTSDELNRSASFHTMMSSSSDSFKSIKTQPKSTFMNNNDNIKIKPIVSGISEDLAWLILFDMCVALDFIHSKGMAHLDLRPANFFLTTSPQIIDTNEINFDLFNKDNFRIEYENMIISRKFIIKLGDFGLCCPLDHKGSITEGETRYCARELINSDEKTLDLTKADIFSLGASVYELCLGKFLEVGDDGWHNLRDGDFDPSLINRYSPNLINMFHQLMNNNPSSRPSAKYLLTYLLPSQYIGSKFESIFNYNIKKNIQLNNQDQANPFQMLNSTDNHYNIPNNLSLSEKDRIIEMLITENKELKRRLAIN